MSSLDRYIESFTSDQYHGIVNRFSIVTTTDHREEKTHHGDMFDRRTGDIYSFENAGVLVGKYVTMLAALPAYASVKAAFHTLAIPYVVLETLYKTVTHVTHAADISFKDQAHSLGHHAIEIARCGYYFTGISLTLLRGIYKTEMINPVHAFETRTMVAKLEREWSHDVPRSADIRYVSTRHDIEHVAYYYLGFCFLPHGNINDTVDGTTRKRFTVMVKGSIG